MQYALLFYSPPIESTPASERELKLTGLFADMLAWRKELEGAGVFRTSLRLAPVHTATSLRRNGKDVLVTDGPFAETKENLGGLIVIECADLDDALRWAKRCPILQIGTVEVRPEFAASQ
ncbi:MAG TPA: YciI family protein [Myxococcota bacterium]|nr:YciI family protein [Myxococcota bacterium]